MVKIANVIESNQRFASRRLRGMVCVFAGATSGMAGKALERISTMLEDPTIYVLGRSPERFRERQELIGRLNPAAKIVFVETEFSLISSVDVASSAIASNETKVDYLCMSPGGMPLNDTKEGLEISMAISYYSRLRLLYNLLPLLNNSPQPRVLSILNGGKEKRIDEQDIGLEKTWTVMRNIKHTTLMTSLAFDHLSASNPSICFLHNFPTLVKSDNYARNHRPPGQTILQTISRALMSALMSFLRLLVGQTLEESGQRQAFHLTSDKYTPGSWRVTQEGEIVPSNEALLYYHKAGWTDKIWDFTVRTWEKALSA